MKGIVLFFIFLTVSLFPIAILAQRTTNFWNGGFSTSWAGSVNWSLGHVPIASEDVNISSGAAHYPYISSSSTYSCNSVYMASGTSLTLQGVLNVSVDFSCYGSLIMNNELADLNIGDDLFFYNGSTLSIPYPGTDINITDDLNFYSGSNINPNYGDFKLNGANSNINTYADASVYNLYIDSPNCQRTLGTAALTVKASFTVYSSRSYISTVNASTFLYGSLWVGSSGVLQFQSGEVFFSGNVNSSVTINGSNYFNDVTIQKDTGVSALLQSSIHIRGDLSLFTGILDSNDQYIYISGDWWEYSGPSGFDESSSVVVFDGDYYQFIYGVEHFYFLYNDNLSQPIMINGDVIAEYYYHCQQRLSVVAGCSFTTNWTEEDGFSGVITVSGYMDVTLTQYQNSDVTGNVIITASGEFHIHGGASPSHLVSGAALYPDGVLHFHDIGFEIWSGALGNMNDGDLYVTGDLRVYNDFYSLSGGSVHILGGGDSYFMPPSTAFTGLHIDKDSSNDNVWVMGREITLMGDLVIENGNLWMDGYDLYLHNNAQISDDLYMEGGSIYIAPNKTFDILSGGWLVVTGTETEPSYVSRIGDSGYYNLNVHADGVIGAEYTVFQYMGLTGINLQSGSLVDQYHCFHHCTFRYGADLGTLITINNNQNVLFYGVNFPTNTWGGNYNVTKTTDQGNVLFVLAAGSFSGAINENDPYNKVDWGITIPPVTDLTIELLPANGVIKLQAYFPYEGAKYKLYKSTSPEGPWDVYSTGSTSIGAIWTYLPTDPMTFFRVILWQE